MSRGRRSKTNARYLTVTFTLKDEIRFRSKVKVCTVSGCWNWTGHRDRDGYGQFWYAGRAHWAPRIAYAWRKGPIPAGYEANHMDACLNPGCVNPDHLDLKTKSANSGEANTRAGYRGSGGSSSQQAA